MTTFIVGLLLGLFIGLFVGWLGIRKVGEALILSNQDGDRLRAALGRSSELLKRCSAVFETKHKEEAQRLETELAALIAEKKTNIYMA
jgi:hypothetical protein